MTSLKYRSYQKELLDEPHIPFEHVKRNMQELDVINHYLGGHKITLQGLQGILKHKGTDAQPLHIVEIGCGGGDNLKVIQQWAHKNKLTVSLRGIDINPECIAYARSVEDSQRIEFIESDYKEVDFTTKPHIIFCSLFCHHFKNEELVFMLQWMKQNTQLGFFINDLHRHPVAFYSIKVMTQLLSKSYLVKNDAPLSVQRGFRKVEWQELFTKAGIAQYTCRWKWAFRWLVTYLH